MVQAVFRLINCRSFIRLSNNRNQTNLW